MSAAEERAEFIVPAELSETAGHHGVRLQPGDRVRLQVVRRTHGEGAAAPSADQPPPETWPPPWVGSIQTGETNLASDARKIMRDESAWD